MEIATTENQKTILLIMNLKDGQALVDALGASLKTLNKRSNAYKLAKQIYDDLPVFML